MDLFVNLWKLVKDIFFCLCSDTDRFISFDVFDSHLAFGSINNRIDLYFNDSCCSLHYMNCTSATKKLPSHLCVILGILTGLYDWIRSMFRVHVSHF